MLWMSWNLRNRALCINYIIGNKITKTISQNYVNTCKDFSLSEELNPMEKKSKINTLCSPKNCREVLNFIKDNNKNMDVQNTLDILKTLTSITYKDESKKDYSYHEGLKILCNNLLKQIRNMTLIQVIHTFKLLSSCDVSFKTFVMQNLLQVIRTNLNQLNINQVHLLMTIFKKAEPTPLSSALQIALPMLVPTIINNSLDYENLHELSLVLQYFQCEEMNQELFFKLCTNIQLVIKKNYTNNCLIDVSRIFISLCKVPHIYHKSKIYLCTLSLVQETISPKLNELKVPMIITILYTIRSNIKEGFMASYDPTFINLLLEVLIKRRVSWQVGWITLESLNIMKYVYKPFLEYVIQHNIDAMLKHARSLIALLHALSNADYSVLPWSSTESRFCNPLITYALSNNNLINYTILLLSLNLYYPELVSTIFLNPYTLLHTVWKRKKLLMLHQFVKVLYPEYKGPWLSESILNQLYNEFTSQSVTKTLKCQLEEAMGGPQYVLSSVKTKIGHFIDYAIMMRKDGHAVAFNNDQSNILHNVNNYIEDLQCPPGNYIILICEFSHKDYIINTQQLRKKPKLYLKSLEKWTNHKCIEINIDAWNALLSHKKVLYFMEKINKVNNDVITKT